MRQHHRERDLCCFWHWNNESQTCQQINQSNFFRVGLFFFFNHYTVLNSTLISVCMCVFLRLCKNKQFKKEWVLPWLIEWSPWAIIYAFILLLYYYVFIIIQNSNIRPQPCVQEQFGVLYLAKDTFQPQDSHSSTWTTLKYPRSQFRHESASYLPGIVQIWWGEPECRGRRWRTWWPRGSLGDCSTDPVFCDAYQDLTRK